MASRNRGDDQIVGQVGWLFADVLLGLAMFYFAIGTSVPVAALPPTATPSPTPLPTLRPNEPTRTPSPTPEPTWTATPSPTVTVTPTATPAVCGVSQKGEIKKIKIPTALVDAGDIVGVAKEIQPELEKEFEPQLRAGDRAGLVFIYGGARDEGAEAGGRRGKRLEASFRRIPAFADAAYSEKGLHDLRYGSGEAEIWVYFLARCR